MEDIRELLNQYFSKYEPRFRRLEKMRPLRIGTFRLLTVSWQPWSVTFVWPCIVTNFFIIKPTRCTNFTNLFWHETPPCFGQFLCPSSGVYSLYTHQWYMSYRFVDSCRAGPGWTWSCSKAVYKPVWHILLLSVQWMNSWWWTEELSETCRVSCQNKFVKLVHLVGFIIKKSLGLLIGVIIGYINTVNNICKTSYWHVVFWCILTFNQI